jgi:hypothetical protein
MTVQELIEELQKHPAHHVVILATPNYDVDNIDYFSVLEVHQQSCVIGPGNTVNIVGEP